MVVLHSTQSSTQYLHLDRALWLASYTFIPQRRLCKHARARSDAPAAARSIDVSAPTRLRLAASSLAAARGAHASLGLVECLQERYSPRSPGMTSACAESAGVLFALGLAVACPHAPFTSTCATWRSVHVSVTSPPDAILVWWAAAGSRCAGILAHPSWLPEDELPGG